MLEPLQLRDFIWGLTNLLKIVLLFLIFRRRLYRFHPVFGIYVLTAVFQAPLMVWSSWFWGAESIQHFNFAWSSQVVVVCARWLTLAEIARRVFGGYSGIRRLAETVLFALGISILAYSVLLSPHRWDLIVLSVNRGVELSMATFVVVMLLFASYYRLAMTRLERQLSIGFCLFSCSQVIVDTAYQISRGSSLIWWQFFDILAFLATLALWINAVRQPLETLEPDTPLVLPADKYGELSQQLNMRLALLNDRLNRLLRSEDSRS